MILKNSQFSILNKNRKEIEYVKDAYKRRVQIEADSFKPSRKARYDYFSRCFISR